MNIKAYNQMNFPTHLLTSVFNRALIIFTVITVYDWFDRYDWKQPFTKLICFSILVLLVTYLRYGVKKPAESAEKNHKMISYLDLGVGVVLIVSVFYRYSIPSSFWPTEVPVSDMATTTYDAARRVFLEFENPYKGQRVDLFKPDIAYCYGPVAIFGYFIAIISPVYGMKLANIVLLIVCAVQIAVLSRFGIKTGKLDKTAAIVFSIGILFVPYRLWSELFIRAANDLLEPILFFAFLLAVHYKRNFVAGLFVGLALSSKIVFGIVGLILMLRRSTSRQFFYGVLLGLVPLGVFALIDYEIFYESFVKFQMSKGFDSTSLHSITPKGIHWIFSVFRWSFAAYIVYRLFKREANIREMGFVGFLLLVVFEVTHGEMHGNHLIWFIPYTALLVTWQRDNANSGAVHPTAST